SAAAMLTPPGYAQAVRLEITPDTVEVRLSWWEKVLGLLKDIRVARADISDVQVVSDPVRVAMGSGIKAGLRLPWLLYVARTIRLDEAFVVRRREPGLSFSVRNHGTLQGARAVAAATAHPHQRGVDLGARFHDRGVRPAGLHPHIDHPVGLALQLLELHFDAMRVGLGCGVRGVEQRQIGSLGPSQAAGHLDQLV